MSDQRLQYTEEIVGANHPAKEDTLNRIWLIEHQNSGYHKNIITPKIANYPVTSTECSGRVFFTNYGATSMVTFTLPSAVAGLKVWFVVVDADGIKVTAASNDTVRALGDTGTILQSTTIGDTMLLQCVNTVEWIAVRKSAGFAIS